MKSLTKIILLALISCNFFCVSVCAAAVSNADITVFLTTDRNDYSSGDVIDLNLDIQNNSNQNISDLSYQILIPKSLKVAEGTALSGKNISVLAGKTFSSNLEFHSATDLDQSNNEIFDENRTSPFTGDNFPPVFWVFVLAFFAVVFSALTILTISQKKKAINMLVFLLISCISFSLTFIPTNASAVPESISVSENILVDGQSNSVSVEVKYSIDALEEGIDSPEENNKTEFLELKIGTTPYLNLGYAICGVIPAQNEKGKWGVIGTNESILVDFEYDEYWNIGEDGSVSLVKYEDGNTICDVYLPDGTVVYHGNGIVQSIGAGVLTIQTGEREITYQKYDGSIIYKATNVNGNEGYLFASKFGKEGYAVISDNFDDYDLSARITVIDMQGNIVFCTEPSYDGETPEGSYFIVDNDCFTSADTLDSDKYIIVTKWVSNFDKHAIKIVGNEGISYDIPYPVRNSGGRVYNSDYQSVQSSEGLTILNLYVNDANEPLGYDTFVYDGNGLFFLYSIPDEKIISLGYTRMEMFEGSGYVLVQKSTGEWGYIDINGKEIAFYDDATNFVGENAIVVEDGKGYVINKKIQRISEMYDCDGAIALGNNTFSILRGDRRYVAVYAPNAE